MGQSFGLCWRSSKTARASGGLGWHLHVLWAWKHRRSQSPSSAEISSSGPENLDSLLRDLRHGKFEPATKRTWSATVCVCDPSHVRTVQTPCECCSQRPCERVSPRYISRRSFSWLHVMTVRGPPSPPHMQRFHSLFSHCGIELSRPANRLIRYPTSSMYPHEWFLHTADENSSALISWTVVQVIQPR